MSETPLLPGWKFGRFDPIRQKGTQVIGVDPHSHHRSTLDIAMSARVCAVNSCIAELRENGAWIECRQIRNPANRAPIRIFQEFSDRWPEGSEWPSDIPRPTPTAAPGEHEEAA